MSPARPSPISLPDELNRLGLLPDREPGDDRTAVSPGGPGWFAEVSPYRDGGVFVVHYAGSTEWERHAAGDEVVMVLDGSSTMTLLIDGVDHAVEMTAQHMIVVPRGVWHRFDTPEGAKILTVTPQPTEHSLERPGPE